MSVSSKRGGVQEGRSEWMDEGGGVGRGRGNGGEMKGVGGRKWWRERE